MVLCLALNFYRILFQQWCSLFSAAIVTLRCNNSFSHSQNCSVNYVCELSFNSKYSNNETGCRFMCSTSMQTANKLLLQYLGSINQHAGLFSGEGEFYLLIVSTLTIKLDAFSCATPLCKLLTSCLLQYLGSTNQHAGLFSGEAELNCKLQIL